MSDDQQQLNSLDRFRKRSDRLILEQYSSCEVPAGCGGVVLRWRDPRQTRPANFYIYSQVTAECYLDGDRCTVGLVDLSPGEHVLAIQLKSANLREALVAFSAISRPNDRSTVPAIGISEPDLRVLSAADGTWRFTLHSSDDSRWSSRDFDDRNWQSLTAKPFPKYDWNAPGAFALDEGKRLGAACLGVEADRGLSGKERSWPQRLWGRFRRQQRAAQRANVWIRKIFTVPSPVEPPPNQGAP